MNTIEYATVRWSRELPDHPAVIVEHSAVTYRELDELVVSAASWLRARGVVAGDRVVICGSNSLAWVVAIHALARLGAVHVPISPRILRAQAERYRRIYSPRLILTDQRATHLWGNSLPVGECLTDAAGPPERPVTSEIDSESLHSIVQTSGSEGEPKGVCLSFRNHLSSALGSALNLGVRPDDCWLLNLPMDRIGGLAIVMRAAIYGTTVVIHDRFDSIQTWHSIDDDRVTQLSLVATTLRRLLDVVPKRSCPAHLRSAMVGGGPIPASFLAEARDRGFPVLPTYGLTETSSQISTLSPTAPESQRYTAGIALPLAEIEIRDDKGRALSDGAEGRIYVRGPMVSSGYWTEDGRVVQTLDQDGWFATNDIGSIDGAGYLQVHGRLDNLIISGGNKTHAEEIENLLQQHEAVTLSLVMAVDDPEWGQRPVAFVELAPGESTAQSDLMEFLGARLPRHKLPRRIEILDAIPILPSGKPDRKLIAARYGT